MQDRLTSLCVDCGLRQAAASSCVGCGSSDVGNLADPSRRDLVLAKRESRFRMARGRQLARMTQSARRAWLVFAAGFGAPAVLLLPVAATVGAVSGVTAALAGVVFLGAGAGIGALWRYVSPRSLVPGNERYELDAQIERLVLDLEIPVASPALPTGAEVVTREGELHAEVRDHFFGTRALALRVVGFDSRRMLDDAWVASGPWTLTTANGEILEVSTTEGVRLDAPATDELKLDRLDDAQVAFLRARGQTVAPDEAWKARVAVLRDGANVKIVGRLVERSAPDGYRGAKVVAALGGPIAVAWDPAAATSTTRSPTR